MSTVLKFRRGDTTLANAFIGQEGELFVDTTKDTLVVHDGVTTGGNPLATESYVTTQIGNLSLFSGSYNDLTNKPTIQSFNQSLNTINDVVFNSALIGDVSIVANTISTIDSYGNPETLVVSGNMNVNGALTVNGSPIGGSGFSGSYNDLTDKPTIPTLVSQLSNDSGFITSSALSGYPTYADLTTQLSTKQNTLVSGTNIKSINGQSLLGGGNITISGGTGGSSLTYGQFADNQVDLTTTSVDQVIDSYPASLYRSSKYTIQAVCSGVGIHSTEIMVMHDGSNVYITEYATMFTDTSLFTVDANITAGDVNLTVTPVNANTSFDVVRTSLAARPYEAPSLQGDLMTLSGTEDLQTSTGSVDLNV